MRQPKKLRKKIMWSLMGLLLVVFGVAGYYVYSLYSFADKIHTDPEDSVFNKVRPLTKTSTELDPPKWEGKERVNILLLGGDSRGLGQNEVPRSDSVMIASLDPVTKKSYLFSILRDTYVSIPGSSMDRINTAITKGGPELAMKTVSNLMGIPVQYYVYTDFKGFIALVDAIGGIELDVEKDMKYSDAADGHQYDINLKKGLQQLDGDTALQYVRFRHDATSDFTRTERQRKFMKALAEKLQSTTSLIKLPSILQSVDPFIETNLNVNQMIKLASLGFEVKTDGMVSQQIPPMELLEEKRVGGAEVIGVDPAALQVFVKQLFGEAPTSTKTPATGGKLSQGTNTGSSGTAASTSPKATVKPTATPKATVKPAATAKPSTAPGKASTSPAAGASATPKATANPNGGEETLENAGVVGEAAGTGGNEGAAPGTSGQNNNGGAAASPKTGAPDTGANSGNTQGADSSKASVAPAAPTPAGNAGTR
jgi:polyisoprenyl-teichoic acid--peptidoglycan teichoic acid transferase